eukprot:gene12327-8816_t
MDLNMAKFITEVGERNDYKDAKRVRSTSTTTLMMVFSCMQAAKRAHFRLKNQQS